MEAPGPAPSVSLCSSSARINMTRTIVNEGFVNHNSNGLMLSG
jgi:hypothetical protein